jgi:hypothetical protein
MTTWELAAAQVPPAGTNINNAGPKPSSTLEPIIAELKKTMKDPYSIRDFRICEPKVAAAFKYPGAGDHWEPAHWIVEFELNAKNGFGAYAGRRYFTASYSGGTLRDVGSPNLGAGLNSKLLALTENCQRVPDAEIQRILTGDGSTVGSAERG